MPQPPVHAPRTIAIEVLRLVAIMGIAVFHTFQTWFEQYASGTFSPQAFSAVALQPGLVFALGLVSLLGSFGNHVFYMISGYFLIPSAARASRTAPYWKPCCMRTVRRCIVPLASVLFYMLVMLIIDAWVIDLERIALDKTAWFISGLQFVWVYVILTACVPFIGWIWQRLPHRFAFTAAMLLIVYALNAYIAFVSPGDAVRDLFEWRKLMSAVTYAATFVGGAALRELIGRHTNPGESKDAHTGNKTRLRRTCTIALIATIAVACIAETVAALPGNAHLVVTFSYKSTSLIAFALAASSLAFAATRRPASNLEKDGQTPLSQRIVLAAAGSTIGFYIAQSMTGELWHPILNGWLVQALGIARPLAAVPMFLLVGIASSVALTALLLVLDACTRRPLFKALKLT